MKFNNNSDTKKLVHKAKQILNKRHSVVYRNKNFIQQQ